jgi:hypothetical protein
MERGRDVFAAFDAKTLEIVVELLDELAQMAPHGGFLDAEGRGDLGGERGTFYFKQR